MASRKDTRPEPAKTGKSSEKTEPVELVELKVEELEERIAPMKVY
jgi:hypothetical protein